jgi:very-short-patch-repair endonuclease
VANRESRGVSTQVPMNKLLHYKTHLKEKAKQLRKQSTLSEVILWKYLKGKHMLGLDFNRQKPIGNYIVDFYNNQHKLAIEIDGVSHDNKVNEDDRKTKALELRGIRVLRIHDHLVKKDINTVLQGIEQWIVKHVGNTPSGNTGHPSF